MNVKIRGVRNPGVLTDERLVLEVTAGPTDIGEFAVFRAGADEGSVTSNVSRVFWFPDGLVKARDLVVLYTKEGTSTVRVNKNGSTSHFYYWGLSEPIWRAENFVAVLTHIDQWESTLKSKKAEDVA